MKKTLPFLLFLLAFSINAQVTITNNGSNCDFPNTSPIDTYSVSGTVNGRNAYVSDYVYDCSENPNQAYCLSYLQYRIEWTGTEWELRAFLLCDWELGEACVPASVAYEGALYATNGANTTLPPNGEWVTSDYLAGSYDCNFILSGGEDPITLSGTCTNFTGNSPIDTYSVTGTLNGRNLYTASQIVECDPNYSQATCVTRFEYNISWSGTEWQLTGTSICIMELGETCIYSNNGTTLMASNSANTTLPPNGAWTINNYCDTITLSGGEDAVLSINDLEKKDSIVSVYPNPTSGAITLDFKEAVTDATLRVFNVKGQTIITKTITVSNRETINISQPAGIYFLNVTLSNGRQYYEKIIKN
jgi:hypothetical protein